MPEHLEELLVKEIFADDVESIVLKDGVYVVTLSVNRFVQNGTSPFARKVCARLVLTRPAMEKLKNP